MIRLDWIYDTMMPIRFSFLGDIRVGYESASDSCL